MSRSLRWRVVGRSVTFGYLEVRDSYPPLDYLLRAPLARVGSDEFWFRFPSVVCSIGAVALFAWWMRRHGIQGMIATALLAVSAFELVHGRCDRGVPTSNGGSGGRTETWRRSWQPRSP